MASSAAFCWGRPAKARRHISSTMRSTTADRRRMAAVPSPVRSAVWRISAISRIYCSRRSSTARTTGFIGVFARPAERKGRLNRISDVRANWGHFRFSLGAMRRASAAYCREKTLFLRFLRGKIDEAALRVGGDEFYGKAVPYIESLATAHQHSLNVRIESADKCSMFVHTGDNGAIALPDARLQYYGGDALLHFALHLARGIFHLRAARRDGIELVRGVGLRRAGKPRFEDALRDHVGKTSVGRSGVRIVLHRKAEMAR